MSAALQIHQPAPEAAQLSLFPSFVDGREIVEPGLYFDISYEEYARIPALNQSTLKLMVHPKASPLHARAAFDGRMKFKSEAMRLGKAEHAWIVEGEEAFREQFTIATPCRGVIKSGRRKGKECGAVKVSRRSTIPSSVDQAFAQAHHLLWEMGYLLTASSHSERLYHHKDGQSMRVGTEEEKVDVLIQPGVDVVAQVVPRGVKITPLWFWYCKTHAPDGAEEIEEYIEQAHLDRIRAMGQRVRESPINGHLSRPGWTEGVIVYDVPVSYVTQWWDDEGNPHIERHERLLRHKIRFDRLGKPTTNRPHIVLDLKRMPVMTGREGLEYRIRDYGWDFQQAMYREAVMRHFRVPDCEAAWIFVEENEPFDVVPMPVDDKTLRVGRHKLHRARVQWCQCEHLGVWPGQVNGEPEPGGLPEWEVKRYLEMFGDDTGRLDSEIGENHGSDGDEEWEPDWDTTE